MDAPIELQMIAAKLPRAEKEWPFAASIGRKWAFDYAWPEHKIALEVEGGSFGGVVRAGEGAFRWVSRRGPHGERVKDRVPIPAGEIIRTGGRHNQPSGMQDDCIKYSWAAILGWCVIRATTPMIRDGIAITLLEEAFKARQREQSPIEIAK